MHVLLIMKAMCEVHVAARWLKPLPDGAPKRGQATQHPRNVTRVEQQRAIPTVTHTPSGMSCTASSALQTLLASGTAALVAALHAAAARQQPAPAQLSGSSPAQRCRRSCLRRSDACGCMAAAIL